MLEAINNALQQAFTTIILALITGISGIVIYYIGIMAKRAKEKLQLMEDERYREVISDTLDRLQDLVVSVVLSIEQEEKQEVLNAISDGNLTRDELFKLKDVAVERIVKQLGPDAMEILGEEFGNAIEYISDKVSQQVLFVKRGLV